MATLAEMTAAVRAHARTNYEKGGWDILVECWEDSDIQHAIGKATTVKGAISKCAYYLKHANDQRRDIQAEVF